MWSPTWWCGLACSISIPGNSSTPLRAATLLTFGVILKWMAKGEKGQRCCYCCTKACGHIKGVYHLGEQKASLLISWGYRNTVQWSLIGSIHQRVCVHVRMSLYVCVLERERETGRRRELDVSLCFRATMKSHTRRSSRLWCNWESAVKDARVGGGSMVTVTRSESRKLVGCWLLF